MAKNIVPFTLGAVCIAIVVGVLALAGAFGDDDSGGRTITVHSTSPPAGGRVGQAGAGESVADIYERVAPGVVFIQTTAKLPANSLFGLPGNQEQQATGSGFVIDDDKGLIVTNQHVIADATRVRIRFGEKGDPIDAKVLGSDPSTDVAVLRVDTDKVGEGLTALELGSSKGLRPGEGTIAIGAPFGLAGTVTTGIISALDRTIQAPNEFTIDHVIQTDAAINPGNSGGPLLDAQGRVIGINSQIATNGATEGTAASAGVGFAVPVDTLKEVVPILEREGEVRRAYLGVSTSDLTKELADRLGFGDRKEGAVVAEVKPGGPADDADIDVGELVVAIDGKKVTGSEDVAKLITAKKPGDKVEIELVQRGGKTVKRTVTLRERPDEPVRSG